MTLRDIIFRKPLIDKDLFSQIIPKLGLELESIREQFFFGGVSGLKSEGATVENISPLLVKGSELDSILKAYQLTTIMGFSFKYISAQDWLLFDESLTHIMEKEDEQIITSYRERYLNCNGEITSLSTCLANDIHNIWGKPEPSHKFISAIGNAATTLGVVCQAATARVFGDLKTEKKLKGLLKI